MTPVMAPRAVMAPVMAPVMVARVMAARQH
jgi:hypothetical protein